MKPLQDLGIAATSVQRLGVDADRKCCNIDKAVLKLDAPLGDFHAKESIAGLHEVMAVFQGLKSYQIGAKHTFKKLLANRKTAEYFGRRESNV